MTLFGTNSNASPYDSFETMVVLQSVIQVKTVSLLETNGSAPTYDSFETMVVLQTAIQV